MTANLNLADAYLQGVTELRAAVAGMSREQFAARPVPGKMSTLEVLCHLTRKQMAPIIRALRPEQFQKTGVHSQKGLLTLEKVIQGAINHVNHHLPFIHEKRKALGLK